jgi:uncharacterized membrane protein
MSFKNYGNGLLVISFSIWILGLWGRDLYLLPLILWVFFILKNQGKWLEIESFFLNLKLKNLIYFYSFLFIINLALIPLSYYSFSWNVWDSGNFSNMLYNLSEGRLWWSYYEVHPWADHFTPTISILALFYKIYPSVLWILNIKLIFYYFTVVFFYLLIKILVEEKKQKIVFIIISSGWILWYKPAVSSLWYEWQPSCLAPPVIVLSFYFLLKSNWIGLFFTLIFLLGLKEHMGVVPCGFGLYLMLNKKIKIGSILFLLGIAYTTVSIYVIMPYFREGLAPWSVPRIEPFENIGHKLAYVVKLMIPVMFLPIIYFRVGILAGPAIGVNWISSNPNMQASIFHYDDVSSTLLFITVILVLSNTNRFNCSNFKKKISFLICIGVLAPPSIGRKIKESIPSGANINAIKEIEEIKNNYNLNSGVAIETSLGAFFEQYKITYISDSGCESEKLDGFDNIYKKMDYIILLKKGSSFKLKNKENCIKKLKLNDFYFEPLRLNEIYFLSKI